MTRSCPKIGSRIIVEAQLLERGKVVVVEKEGFGCGFVRERVPRGKREGVANGPFEHDRPIVLSTPLDDGTTASFDAVEDVVARFLTTRARRSREQTFGIGGQGSRDVTVGEGGVEVFETSIGAADVDEVFAHDGPFVLAGCGFA